MCSGRLGHHSFCDCRNAHKDDEELEDRGIAAIWFDVVNGQKQHSGNEANAEDVYNPDIFLPSLTPNPAPAI